MSDRFILIQIGLTLGWRSFAPWQLHGMGISMIALVGWIVLDCGLRRHLFKSTQMQSWISYQTRQGWTFEWLTRNTENLVLSFVTHKPLRRRLQTRAIESFFNGLSKNILYLQNRYNFAPEKMIRKAFRHKVSKRFLFWYYTKHFLHNTLRM